MASSAQSLDLPAPPAEAQAVSAALARLIEQEIAQAGGWIPFARYMELSLYAPGLGYYMAGARKLGRDGDFVTAPEISPLFGRVLARQIAPLVRAELPELLEIGAGSGALAVDLLLELERLGCLPARYLILELSADLRARSRDTIAARAPQHMDRVAWLNALPPAFTGVIVGNEVLDAMPVHVYSREGTDISELGVEAAERAFRWAPRPLAPSARAAVDPDLFPASSYRTEIQSAARAFIGTLGATLERGAAFFFDYGFPQHEYYHPQRDRGTLMCHYRHRAHDDPFFLPGLQDITCHIDFSAMAQAGREAGLELLGYASQAQFLVNCGITDLLGETPAEDVAAYAPLASAVQKLLSPAEMGELFKVIAFGKKVILPLPGFSSGDRSRTL